MAQVLNNSLGRKKLLMLCAVLFALTGVGTGWATSFPLFVGFRMLSGVAVGAAALVCLMYVAEISPAPMRGRMVSFYQLSIVIGILLAYLFNYMLLGRALIANNVSAFNGGSGIHTFRTKHVDIINNTTYHNGGIVGYQELFPNNSEDVVILNNIIVPRPGGQVTSNNKNTNIRWDYNLYSKPQNIWKGAHDIVADPQFVDIQYDPAKCDFRLKKGSQALDSGCNDVPQLTDIDGKDRPKEAGRDRGAYEQ